MVFLGGVALAGFDGGPCVTSWWVVPRWKYGVQLSRLTRWIVEEMDSMYGRHSTRYLPVTENAG